MGLREEEVIGMVRHAFARDPKLDAPKITISMIEGQVALTGVLDSPEQVQRAETVVQQLLPTVKVDNSLTVGIRGDTHTWQDSSLNEVAMRTLEKAKDKFRSRPSSASVEVRDGIARLHGNCATAKDRQALINAMAGVPGIREVQSDDLQVAPFGTADDIRLGNLVEERLQRLDPALAGAVGVTVHDRSAHLTGRLRNEHLARRVEDIAMAVPGIKRVHCEFEFYQQSDPTHTHATLEQDIKHALGRAGLPVANMAVFVTAGTVSLAGEVDAINQKRLAMQIASQHAGHLYRIDNAINVAGRRSWPKQKEAEERRPLI